MGAFGGGAARLHVDLGRLASAICTSGTATRPARAAL
ncbi:putative leader peptide [Streptomyces sp. NPDC000963]|nr:putative leader peptide [Streptomyces sp. WAC08241]